MNIKYINTTFLTPLTRTCSIHKYILVLLKVLSVMYVCCSYRAYGKKPFVS